MTDFYFDVGDSVTFSKTVGESDVYLFAGITGDLAPNHVDEAFMRKSAYGRRIAHGVLLMGFMSTCSSLIIAKARDIGANETPVSLGYDRVRFLAGVGIGETITVTYTITRIEPEKRRSYSKVVITNEAGQEVTVAEHILKWVKNPG
jgi:3-hydroxybutyryl-CoA dehydratase